MATNNPFAHASPRKGCALGIGCLTGLGLVLFLLCGGLFFFSGQANDARQQVRNLPPQQPPRVEPPAKDVRPERARPDEKRPLDASPPQNELRTWTSSTGKFTIEAEFVGVENGNVQLRKSDGKSITVPLAKLSDDDQQFIKGQSLNGAEAPEPPEPLAKFTACLKNGKRIPVRDYQEDGDGFILFSVGEGKIRYEKSLIERFEPCTESDLATLQRKIAAAQKQAARRQAQQQEKARQTAAVVESGDVDDRIEKFKSWCLENTAVTDIAINGRTTMFVTLKLDKYTNRDNVRLIAEKLAQWLADRNGVNYASCHVYLGTEEYAVGYSQ
jgi:hypothetical protein